LISFTISASAAIPAGTAETASMILIGAGLILGASLARFKTRRG
jgi:hypothetical protein